MIAATAAAALTAAASPPLPGFLNVVAGYLTDYGYWAIVLLVFVEDFGIPVPGETILIAGAVDAGAGRLQRRPRRRRRVRRGHRRGQHRLRHRALWGPALVARWGKYVLLTEERLGKAEHFFDDHGGKVIVVARFIEGLRQANGIIAGLSRMHWLKFFAFNMLGAALWVGCWVSAGYFGGQHIGTIYHYVAQYTVYALIALAVAVAAWAVLFIRKRRRKAAEAEANADADAEAGADADADGKAENPPEADADAEAGADGEAEASAAAARPARSRRRRGRPARSQRGRRIAPSSSPERTRHIAHSAQHPAAIAGGHRPRLKSPRTSFAGALRPC